MKKILLSLIWLIIAFTGSVEAENINPHSENIDKACTYLGEFCEIAKLQCSREKAVDPNGCFMDYAKGIALSQKSGQIPTDIKNLKYGKEACDKLGSECDYLRLECLSSNTGMFHFCMAFSYFEIEVAKELCGVTGYLACLERDKYYGNKVIQELTLPNVGTPLLQIMWDQCKETGNYKVTSKELRNFYHRFMETPKHLVGGAYEHKKQEEYYECMKEVMRKSS